MIIGRNRYRSNMPLKKKRKIAEDGAEATTPPSLGTLLVQDGILTEEQLWDAYGEHVATDRPLAAVLQARGLASEAQITRAHAHLYGVAYTLLDDVIPAPEALAVIPAEIAESYLVLPLSLETRDNSPLLRLAMVNPWDSEFLTLLHERTGCVAAPFLAGEQDVLLALARAYAPAEDVFVQNSPDETPEKPQLADILVAQGALTEAQRDLLAEEAAETGQSPLALLQARGWADDEQIARAQAVQYEIPYASLSVWFPTSEALACVPYDRAAHYLLLPLALLQGDGFDDAPRLQVAVAHPWDAETHQEIESSLGCALEPFLAAELSLLDALDRAYPGPEALSVNPVSPEAGLVSVDLASQEDDEPKVEDDEIQPVIEIADSTEVTVESVEAAEAECVIETTTEQENDAETPEDAPGPTWIDVEAQTPEIDALALVPHEIAQYYQVLPLARLTADADPLMSLHVAMAEPGNQAVISLLAQHLGCLIIPFQADPDALIRAIENIYAPPPVTTEDVSLGHDSERQEAAAVPPPVSAPPPTLLPALPGDELEELLPLNTHNLAPNAAPNLTPALLPEHELLEKLPAERSTRLGDILVEQGVITAHQLTLVLEEQIVTQQRLGAILMNHQWADEEAVTRARSVQFDVPYLDVTTLTPDPMALDLLSYTVARQHQVLPVSLRDEKNGSEARLVVAMTNPWDVEVIDLVHRQAHRRIEPYLASEGGLRAALERAYQGAQENANDLVMSDSLAQAGEGVVMLSDTVEEIDLNNSLQQVDQAPVVRFVNTLLSDAVRRRASDIHIEPRKNDFLLRYRVDGQLQMVRAVPRQFLAPTTSRLKIMAEIDISERRLPQDGRIGLRIDGKNIDLRVSTLPAQYGERIVMRVLDRSSVRLGLDQLDFSPRNQDAFDKLIHQPHGIILVTGPTGSGKTTTLYAALNALRSPTTNILTVEDPIEYELEGISQTAVNEKAGLTFAKQLRAILRQDPDVILVGEIRDAETAEIAFRAALTGHLVLSTLHCNEAAGAISRLIDMGVEPFLIASTVIGVIGQRLVRRLCPACRRETVPDERQTAIMRDILGARGAGEPTPSHLYEPVGCTLCDSQGTRGRLAVHEVMTVSSQIHRLTMDQADTGTLRKAALEAGMIPITTDGLEKAGTGLTTLEDIQRRLGTLHDD